MSVLARRAAIVGVGLIGGSLGMRWRAAGAVGHVVGFGRNPDHLRRAVDLGAIDEAALDLGAAVADADLVVLGAPVQACIAMAPEVARLAAAGALLTDVASTKSAIGLAMARALRERNPRPQAGGDGAPPASGGPGDPAASRPGGSLRPHGPVPAGAVEPPTFVGGHPMAGAERAGVEAADPYLFENAVWVLCPGPDVPPAALDRLVALVEAAGAHPAVMDASRHDRRVAAISHLPQLAAVALAEAAGRGEAADPGLLALAGGGFRDTTRIAQSPADMWLDVLETNRGPILDQIDGFQAALADLRAAVERGDPAAIRRHFEAAAAARRQVPARQKGLLPNYHDLVLVVPDRPGVIGALCGALGAREINVQDIEILRLREGEGGTLRLGFRSAAEASAALEVLTTLGYRVQRR